MWLTRTGSIAAQAMEIAGVAVIIGGSTLAFGRGFIALVQKEPLYKLVRERVGKAVLLGLELLVGADIIRTVTTEPRMDRVLVLGLIVLVRTFLSVSLEMELAGKWPWQRGDMTQSPR